MENNVTEAIVLAGGAGTRLQPEIGELPKTLAPVNGQPFLHYLLRYLKKNGIQSVILSVGHGHERIIGAIGNEFEGIQIQYVIEDQPMGTGGALKLALEKATSGILFVLNGDSFFDIDLQQLAKLHTEKQSTCTIALKEMQGVSRYGSVDLDENQKIIAFHEKQFNAESIINGGIYCINKGILIHYPVGTPFSFEANYLERNASAKNMYGLIFDHYFIDIGLPEDYRRFEKDIQA